MFDGLKHHFTKAVNYVMQVISDSGLFKKQLKNSVIRAPRPINLSPIGYFDGAAQEGNCYIGGFLIILGKNYYELSLCEGFGQQYKSGILSIMDFIIFCSNQESIHNLDSRWLQSYYWVGVGQESLAYDFASALEKVH